MTPQSFASALLPILGLINGVFMSLSPAKAAKKILKFDDKEIKPAVLDLVQANGVSSFALAVVELFLRFTTTDHSKAVAYSMIPRVFFLLYGMMQKTKLGTELLEPRNIVKIAMATLLIEGKFLNPVRSMQVRGGLYLALGILFVMAPAFIANKTSQFSANDTTERCLRARGKTDIVYGSLTYGLATMSYHEALGFACLAWFVSSLYGDFIIQSRDRFRLDAFTQLAISSVCAGVLLSA